MNFLNILDASVQKMGKALQFHFGGLAISATSQSAVSSCQTVVKLCHSNLYRVEWSPQLMRENTWKTTVAHAHDWVTSLVRKC